MGIDVGTYESKGVLIDGECRIICQAAQKHGLENPRPGWYEHDAQAVWWGDVCKISRLLLDQSGLDPAKIACVGLSALGCDCVPVDKNCKPLCNAILYGIDSRAQEEIEQIKAYYGDRFSKVFPRSLVSSSISPKILWIKNHLPAVYAKTYKFLTASSFLTAKMTGRYCIDKYLSGSFAPLYDENGVNEAECGLFCRPDQLAEITLAPDVVGTVTPEAAALTGLMPGTKVLTGTGDSGAESVSCGVFTPGTIMIQLGSTCFFIYNADQLPKDSRIWPGHYLIPDTYCVAAGTNNGGTLTKWYRDQLFAELLEQEATGGENAYAVMAKIAGTVPAGSEGLITLPYFAGERTPINDPLAKGMLFGLQSHHTRAHLYRSALEGIGYSIAQHFEVLDENGLPVTKIMAVGGGTKNSLWLQIIADMLGREILVPEVTVGASYGDAILCALACGCYDSFEALGQKIRVAQTVRPIAENHRLYQKNKPVFRALYEATKELMHQI
ncbi:MAG: FGGY-family carbohydrate kinase [Oscillospiraceae bacterium]|nr:FGGY-family carbohydrate kinase [Oscillospiraceae bacterium]